MLNKDVDKTLKNILDFKEFQDSLSEIKKGYFEKGDT